MSGPPAFWSNLSDFAKTMTTLGTLAGMMVAGWTALGWPAPVSKQFVIQEISALDRQFRELRIDILEERVSAKRMDENRLKSQRNQTERELTEAKTEREIRLLREQIERIDNNLQESIDERTRIQNRIRSIETGR